MVFQQPIHEPFSFTSLTDERWKSYLEGNPRANIFHHPAWSLLLAESYAYEPFIISATNAQGEIEAAVPFLKIKSFLNRERWVSLPFTDHCTPLFSDHAALQRLTNHLMVLTKKQKELEIELRWDYPEHPEIYKISNFVQHRLKLAPNELDVSKRIKPTHFRRIKTSEERGVRIERGYDERFMKDFYFLHSLTRQRHGIPVQPWKFFELLTQKITQRGLGFILLAYKEDKCIAGAVFLNWNETLVYKYSASIETARQLHATDLILWTAIRWGCENGYLQIDLGRTDVDDMGLRAFKNRWGAEEIPLTYSILSQRPLLSSTSRMMSLVRIIIRKSPLWVCKLAGELFYKHFG